MDVSFSTSKLQKICNSEAVMRAKCGMAMAKKLQQRLLELSAAETLAQISRVPPARCHELTGKLKGSLSVDLVHPYRLLFEANHSPLPVKPDGGLDWTKVTAVVVVGITDTH